MRLNFFWWFCGLHFFSLPFQAKFLVGEKNLPGSVSGLRFLAGSGSGFDEYGSETLLSSVLYGPKYSVECFQQKSVGNLMRFSLSLSLFKSSLRKSVSRFLTPCLRDSYPSGLLIHMLKYFLIRVHGDICIYKKFLQFHWHCGVKLHSIIDTMESGSTVLLTPWSQTPQYYWHRGVKLHSVYLAL